MTGVPKAVRISNRRSDKEIMRVLAAPSYPGRSIVTFALFASLLTTACGMPPLDEAQVQPPALATTEDLSRYAQAEELMYRESFGGAYVPGPDGTMVTFGPDEYDAYLSHQGFTPDGQVDRFPTYWPVIRVAFSTAEDFVGRSDSGQLYWCDAALQDTETGFHGSANVMWRGQFVSQRVAEDIEAAAVASSSPQDYEILFPYTHIVETRPLPRGTRTLTVAPPESDLCFALIHHNMMMPPAVGRPLRISRNGLAAALGPLPRSIWIGR